MRSARTLPCAFQPSRFAMERHPVLYIITNRYYGTLYIGVTANLAKRIWEHRNHVMKGFATEYGLNRLVWYDSFETMLAAIDREEQLRKWNRQWKIDLINERNPEWRDLWDEVKSG